MSRQILRRATQIAMLAMMSTGLLAQNNQVSANMEVSASVAPNCRMTLTPLRFGAYDPFGAHARLSLDGTASLRLTCTKDARATISMDHGRNAAGDGSQRRLSFADQRLAYHIFRDAARTEAWGRGADAFRVVAGTGIRSAQDLTVYGRIEPGQDVASGTYTDVVTATVDF